MLQPIPDRSFQSGKYFAILKFIILQQNITSVWIFGDQHSWMQHGQVMNGVLRDLVGSLPKYVFDLNNTKTKCVNAENAKNLNIFFVSQTFGSKELTCVCPTDYTMVLVQNSSTEIILPQKQRYDMLQRTVFGTINISTIADLNRSASSASTFSGTNKPMTDLFIIKSLNLNGSDFRIFFRLRPTSSMFILLDKKYIYYGTDAQMAHVIAKKLNATAIIQTNVGIEYPTFESWFYLNETRNLKADKLLKIRRRMLPPNAISDFYQNCSDCADLYITAEPIKGNNQEITELLYPHDKECLRIVVPLIRTEQRFVGKIFKNRIVRYIWLTVALMFISKIILNRSYSVHDWTVTLFSILATIFGQQRPTVSPKIWETIWNTQLILFVIYSTAALSAICYQTLVSVKYVRQIDTLNDLIESNLQIFVQNATLGDFGTWGHNLNPKLSSKFVYQKGMINLIHNKTDVAFVWENRMAFIHLMASKYAAPDGELPAMRLALEPLYCRLTSARVASGSPFQNYINELFQQMIENGILTRHSEWIIQYFRAWSYNNTASQDSNNKFRPLTLSRNYGIFVLYGGGLVLGSVVFVLEIVWKWMRKHKKHKVFHRRAKRGERSQKKVRVVITNESK